MPLITFLMPALNEEAGIEATIATIPRKMLKQAGYRVEVLVIDGGSTDATVSLARKAGARVMIAPRGYGLQYQRGLKEAKGVIIITGDADATYPFEDALTYVHALTRQNLDFITINRFAHLAPHSMSSLNRLGNFFLTQLTNLLYGFSLQDSQSGMWIIRRTALSQLCVSSPGMSFSQELKIEAFTKLRSVELPGRYKARLGETKLLKWKDGFKNLCHLFIKRTRKNA